MEIDKELEEKCLKERTIVQKPTVTKIENINTINSLANQHRNNAEYYLEATKTLLKSNTPLVAYITANFAMEHKANELLALNGYKVESHICAQLCLSRVLGKPSLAKKLSQIFNLRQAVGYRMVLKFGEEERANVNEVIDETVIPFISEIDNLITQVGGK